MTKQHIKNKIAYLERMLRNKPEEQYYMGNSDCAESAVEQGNRYNEQLAEEIEKEIALLKIELKSRFDD